MNLSKFIKLEPIDVTQIIVTAAVLTIVIFAFKTQLNDFFDSLQDRPIKVTMSGSETTIQLDAPVRPELVGDSVPNPDGTPEQLDRWAAIVSEVENLDGFGRLGFGDLYERLANLQEGQLAVINFEVDDSKRGYFGDESMLKYLSIASEKVAYLAFYKDGAFVATLRIQDAIAGLASRSRDYRNFGDKLKNGKWRDFSGLIFKDVGFDGAPSIKDLRQRLVNTELDAVPLAENGVLVGFLDYKSISAELYRQADIDWEVKRE